MIGSKVTSILPISFFYDYLGFFYLDMSHLTCDMWYVTCDSLHDFKKKVPEKSQTVPKTK